MAKKSVGVPPHRTGRPKGGPSREERRSELIDAALGVISSVGPSASMDEIAEGAGLTKPVLYRHFGDKAGMASALAAALGDRLTAELTTSLAGALADLPPGRSAARRHARLEAIVVAALDAFVAFVEQDPNLFRFVIHPPGAADPKKDVIALTDRAAEAIVLVLRAEVGDGQLTPLQEAVVGRSVVGGAYAVAEWWDRDRSVPRAALVAELAAFVVAGIEASLRA